MNTTTKAKTTKPPKAKPRANAPAEPAKQSAKKASKPRTEMAPQASDPLLDLLTRPEGATRDELASATGMSLAQVRARIGHIRTKLGFKIVLRAVKEQGA